MPRRMLPTLHLSILLLLHIVLLLAGSTNALPTVLRARVDTNVRRQDGNITEPMIVETSRTSNTSMGPMNEACSVSLTPITLEDGQEAVELVKNCTVSLSGSDGTGSNLTTTTSALNPSSSPALPPATSTLSSAPSSSESPSPSSPEATTTPLADNGVATGTPDTDPISPTTPPVETENANERESVLSGISATGTAAGAVESPAGTATYSVQGKKLSVLPIGLGVFAGISVIALVIVGLVTYERTKYRKAFRERKRAEESLDFGSRALIG